MVPSHIGRYQIVNRIGQGGMGTVYLARDPAIDRLLAIKVLKEEFDEDQRRRFKQEALLAGKLPHVNIVTIYDVGDHEGRPFIAMSYIPGETLAQLIHRRAPLPLAGRLRIVADLCSGLQAAHREGIVHRDIKPANVMVDPGGVVKILDFGIARLLSEGTLKTQDGTIIGSYNYMSPEQLTGKPLDHRSDIFAVGAILYELVSYTRAFEGSVGDGLLYRVVHEAPTPLRSLCKGLDEELERVVLHALEKDPGDRYGDIEGMRRDLTRVMRRLIASELGPLLEQAEQALRTGQYELARDSAQRALVLEPDELRALDLVESARKGLDERQMRAQTEAARTAARADMDQARALHRNGGPRDALKMMNARLSHLPPEWDDLRADAAALRNEVEDAFTRQVIDAERRRQAAAKPAEAMIAPGQLTPLTRVDEPSVVVEDAREDEPTVVIERPSAPVNRDSHLRRILWIGGVVSALLLALAAVRC